MLLSRWLSGGRGDVRADADWTPIDPLDPFWYTASPGVQSAAGIYVAPENILRCGTVLAALRFLGDAVALCTPQLYVELPGNRREQDREHYLHRTLRKPNVWQTGYRWRHYQMVSLGTYGNSYNRIVPGPGSFADELRPLHPSRVRLLDQAGDGTLVYQYTPPQGGSPEKLTQNELLHFRGISTDGMVGEQIYALIRQAVGVALAAERHQAVFLRKGTRVAGVLSSPTALEKDVRERFKESWKEAFSGTDQVGGVPLLEAGMTFTPMTADHQKSQMIELTDHQVGAILRAMGVPGVVVGWGDKTATYASAKEFFESGGIKHCVLPWVENLEDEIDATLLPRDDPHYVKFNLGVLMRANLKDRYEANFKATGRPWMTVNEVRTTEDLNPDSDPASDAIAVPVNMGATLAEPPEPEPETPPEDQPPPRPPGRGAPPPPSEEEQAMARVARRLAVTAAARLVRKEVAFVRGGQKRFAGEAWELAAWARRFYEEHAQLVAETLGLGPAVAAAYAQAQMDVLLARGAVVADGWEQDTREGTGRVAHLVALTLSAGS